MERPLQASNKMTVSAVNCVFPTVWSWKLLFIRVQRLILDVNIVEEFECPTKQKHMEKQ